MRTQSGVTHRGKGRLTVLLAGATVADGRLFIRGELTAEDEKLLTAELGPCRVDRHRTSTVVTVADGARASTAPTRAPASALSRPRSAAGDPRLEPIEPVPRDVARGVIGPYVLVVDDDPTIGRMVRRILRRAGFAVGVLERGRDAIAHTLTWIPDVILVDVQLGDMDGSVIVRELRERFGSATPPLIAMTGEGREHVEGCVAVCSKPFAVDRLVALVSEHARRDSASSP